MRVMTCPELRIVETLAEGIVVEHPYSTAQHALATPIAQLLELHGGVAAVTALALGQQVQRGADAEGREDVRRDLQAQIAPDLPGFFVARQINLAAHDHADELVAR